MYKQEDVLAHLSTQEREDITHFAMEAVRKIHYGLVIILTNLLTNRDSLKPPTIEDFEIFLH